MSTSYNRDALGELMAQAMENIAARQAFQNRESAKASGGPNSDGGSEAPASPAPGDSPDDFFSNYVSALQAQGPVQTSVNGPGSTYNSGSPSAFSFDLDAGPTLLDDLGGPGGGLGSASQQRQTFGKLPNSSVNGTSFRQGIDPSPNSMTQAQAIARILAEGPEYTKLALNAITDPAARATAAQFMGVDLNGNVLGSGSNFVNNTSNATNSGMETVVTGNQTSGANNQLNTLNIPTGFETVNVTGSTGEDTEGPGGVPSFLLNDPNINQSLVAGNQADDDTTITLQDLLNLPTVNNTPVNSGGDIDLNDPSIIELVVNGVKKGITSALPLGFSFAPEVLNFVQSLPEGDFTPAELDTLVNANNASVVVKNQGTERLDTDGGSDTTTGGITVPRLGGIGSLGRGQGFVTRDDVLVPSTGQMGDIYSIRQGDTRGRFAAPEYVNPYAPVSAPGGEMRTMPIGPIAAAPVPTPQAPTPTPTPVAAASATPTLTPTGQAVTDSIPTTNMGPQQRTAEEILTAMGPSTLLQDFTQNDANAIANLLETGQTNIGQVANTFDNVDGYDVIEGLLRGGYETPAQVTARLAPMNEGLTEVDLIANLLNQDRANPDEVAAYYSRTDPDQFSGLTGQGVTDYLTDYNQQKNFDYLTGLTDQEVGALINDKTLTAGQAASFYQDRYPGLSEADVNASLNQMRSQGVFGEGVSVMAEGGVVEKADGIESLLDKRQQAVNRMLSKRAVAQFRDGGAVVKKPLAPANFAGGGIATKLIQKGAEMLGFDDERQLDITREAVDLTNQMVNAGLVDPRFRVNIRMPTSGEPSTRQNTGIEGDEEVFNAVNHALFSYHAGKSPLARAGSQAKEIYQGIRLAGAGKDPGSESLDYFNNMFGFDLARQGLSPEEAKNAIIDNIANINNQGAMSRLQAGEPLVAGKDLSRTAEDIRGSGPDVSAFDVLAGVQGLKDGGPPEKVPASFLEGRGNFYGTSNERPRVDTGEQNLTLQKRLDQATPLEQYAFEVLGLEPGLDRAMLLPEADRRSGSQELAVPGLAYDTLKAMLAPAAALKGGQITPEETIELAMETMGGGAAMPGVDIGTDVMAGMAAKPKGGVFVPMRPEEDPFSPRFNKFGEPSYFSEAGQETIPANYGRMLVEAGMDEELAMDIAKRAENYFKKSFGTGSDPLKLKILEGQIEPNVEGLELNPDYMIPSDLLMQARKDYAEAKTDPSKANSPALMQFEEVYDRATTIQGEANYPEEGYRSARKGLIEEEAAKMEAEGVSPAFQNQPALGPIDLEDVTPDMLENPTLQRALEEGEAIYDIYPYGLSRGSLDVVLPEETIQGIMTLSPEKLKNMSFPDIIANAQKSVEAKDVKTIRNFSEALENQRLDQLEAAPTTAIAVQQILNGPLPDPKFLLEKGVDKVVDLGNDSWFKITNPLYTELEGALMDHSVRGYAEPGSYNLGGRKAIESGRAGVFSLRNNQTGRPRVTVEIDFMDPDRPKPTKHMYGPQNSAIQAKDFDNLITLFDEVGVLPQDLPQYLQEPYKKFKDIGTSDMLDYFGIDPEV